MNKFFNKILVVIVLSITLLPSHIKANKETEYKYILESSLKEEERKNVVATLAENHNQDIVYVVYRPNATFPFVILQVGAGVILAGFIFLIFKRKKKQAVVAVVVLTLISSNRVLANVNLSSYDKKQAGTKDVAIKIEGYTFVGYYLPTQIETTKPTQSVTPQKEEKLTTSNTQSETATQIQSSTVNPERIVVLKQTPSRPFIISNRNSQESNTSNPNGVATTVENLNQNTVLKPEENQTVEVTPEDNNINDSNQNSQPEAPAIAEPSQNTTDDEILNNSSPKPKATPVVTINKFNSEVASEKVILDDKAVTQSVIVSTSIENSENIKNQKVQLFKNEVLVASESLSEKIELTNLEYDQLYRLETTISYDIGNGLEAKTESKSFILELNKLEIKDVKEYRLFKKENNQNIRILNMETTPSDLSNYYVEIISDVNKTIILPVSKIEEENNQFRAEIAMDDLVEKREGKYFKNHDFYIQKAPSQNITSFKQLVDAINQNPSGTFELGSDISASQLDVTAVAYVTTPFNGRLVGNNHTIYDLKKPLFAKLASSGIESLHLKDVNIETSEYTVGALAKSSNDATILNVTVSGTVAGQGSVGGIIGDSVGSILSNVAMQGIVKQNLIKSEVTNIGGIVGDLRGGLIRDALSDTHIQIFGTNNNARAGTIVGKAGDNYPSIRNVVAKGNVVNTGYGGQVGGVIGSLWNSGSADNVITYAKVSNGNIVYGDSGDKTTQRINNVFIVDGVASGNEYLFRHDRISNEVADEKVKAMDIIEIQSSYVFKMNYKGDELAAKNVEKFIPFYNQAKIEKYAEIAKSTLNSKKILSITPMFNQTIIGHVTTPESINKIMVHYEDETVKFFGVTFNKNFNQNIFEYNVDELGIIYTPDMIIVNNQSALSEVANSIKALDYNSVEIAEALSAYNSSEVKNLVNNTTSEDQAKANLAKTKMRDLYLEEAFNDVIANIDTILADILANDKMIAIDTTNQLEKIKANKIQIVMALSYLRRWYNINFDKFNIRDLLILNQDFDGDNIETIDYLIHIGKTGYEGLRFNNHLDLFKNSINHQSLFHYFEKMKNKFTTYTDMDTWFKNNTNIYIGEADLGLNSEVKVNLYEKMTKEGSEYNEMVLPLLTAQEGIYAIASINSISFGMYDRYFDMNLKQTNLEQYEYEKQRFENELTITTQRQKDYYNFWYLLLEEPIRSRLNREITVWDGYSVGNKWLNKDSANQAMKDFFLPINRYYDSQGYGAVANGNRINYQVDKIVTYYGQAVFSHEQTHNNDGYTFFNGYGRRNDIGAEYFARGMLEVISDAKSDKFGLNSMYDFSSAKNSLVRTQPLSPTRIHSEAKLNDYMHKMFDVIYSLDYLEGMVMVNESKANQMKWFNQMQTIDAWNTANVRVAMPDITIQSFNDLIDNELISKRGYPVGDSDQYNIKSNGYYYVSMFDPIYGGGQNDNGAAGDIMFKRMAFELMAYKGYHNGFVPYVSNQLKTLATQKGYAKVVDPLVIEFVSNGEFKSMNEFKKAMFKERADKLDTLKPITINYNNKSISLNNVEEMRSLFKTTIENDLKNNSNEIRKIKNLIYTAYLNLTNDFESSIYR